MKPEEQLEEWIKGNSIHNKERDECCPDFSCCNKAVNTPIETRKAFKEANEALRWEMLGMFLGNAFATEDSDNKIYVAGQGAGVEQ